MSPGPALVAALLLAAPAPPPALEALVDQVRAQTAAAHPEAPVAVAIQAPSAMLGEAASTLLATRLGDSGLPAVVIGPGEDAPARARSAGARSLIRLRLEVGAEVAAAGDLRPVWRNFWEGRTPIESGPTRVLSAAVPVDRATQLLATGTAQGAGLVLDPVPLARFPVRTAALTTGDLDGDGRPEVVVLAGGELWVLDGAGTLLARHSLLDLPSAAAPAREPFGTLCISDGRLLVGWARAESPVALRLQGGQLVRGPGAPGPTLGCGD
ncbi:MAG TPA: VCBS repeat-containing protein, partial [Myxococcaceae bacterium]